MNANPTNTTRSDRKPDMIRRPVGRAVVCMAIACVASVLSARPAAAQATYSYQGNPFTMFSCGPNADDTATLSCSTPYPTNTFTSYTATDHVVATLVLDNPLPANLAYQGISTFSGFSLTMNDGQHIVTNAEALGGMFAEVSTDASGNILQWRFVLNTGGVLNGGIATYTAPFGFVADQGVLACCDPTVSGNLASNSSSRGTWTSGSGTPSPATLVTTLMTLVSDPLLQLTMGQNSSLETKLTNALASIQAGQNKQAINQLNAFINSVQTWLKTGKISPTTATTLSNAAAVIIAAL